MIPVRKTIFLIALIGLMWPFSVLASQTLVIGVGKDGYISSGPRKNLGRYPLNANIFETLTTFDDQYRLKPCLAVLWEYKGDRRWRFFLRKNVRFHDSTPFHARAVKAFLENLAKTGTSLLSFKQIEEVKDHILDIITEDENMLVPYILSNPYMGIEKPGNTPVGTGPFRFLRYEKNRFLEVAQNPSYWGEPPEIDKIVFRFVPDTSTRMVAFMAKELDMALEIPWNRLPVLKQQPDTRLFISRPGSYVSLLVSAKGILKDRNLRMAVSMGIDRKAIVNALWDAKASFRQTLIPPDMLNQYASNINDIPFDPDRAKRLVKGKPVRLKLVSGFPNAQVHKELPEIIQFQLKAVGIDVAIVTINDMGLYHSMLKKNEGDLFLEKGSVNSADLTFIPYLVFHRDGYYPKVLQTSAGSVAFHEQIENARKAKTPSDLMEHTSLAIQEVVHNQVLAIPIAILPEAVVARKTIVCDSPDPTLLSMRWDHFRKIREKR